MRVLAQQGSPTHPLPSAPNGTANYNDMFGGPRTGYGLELGLAMVVVLAVVSCCIVTVCNCLRLSSLLVRTRGAEEQNGGQQTGGAPSTGAPLTVKSHTWDADDPRDPVIVIMPDNSMTMAVMPPEDVPPRAPSSPGGGSSSALGSESVAPEPRRRLPSCFPVPLTWRQTHADDDGEEYRPGPSRSGGAEPEPQPRGDDAGAEPSGVARQLAPPARRLSAFQRFGLRQSRPPAALTAPLPSDPAGAESSLHDSVRGPRPRPSPRDRHHRARPRSLSTHDHDMLNLRFEPYAARRLGSRRRARLASGRLSARRTMSLPGRTSTADNRDANVLPVCTIYLDPDVLHGNVSTAREISDAHGAGSAPSPATSPAEFFLRHQHLLRRNGFQSGSVGAATLQDSHAASQHPSTISNAIVSIHDGPGASQASATFSNAVVSIHDGRGTPQASSLSNAVVTIELAPAHAAWRPRRSASLGDARRGSLHELPPFDAAQH